MNRRRYLDWARGVAVLLMIQAHALDAWTVPAARDSINFRNLVVLGGFAAPLFLFLAGAGLMIAAGRASNWRAAAATGVRRGLFIFALAFLFRLQALIVSPGGPLMAFLRVDILNIIGLSMMAAAIVCVAAGERRRAVICCGLAAVVLAMFTPIVRAATWVDRLPGLLQWYLRPAGIHTTFTLLPWAGFLFAGAAWGGAACPADPDRRREHLAHLLTTIAGVVLIALGSYTASRPALYSASSFWTSSPTFFAIRVGVLLVALAALQAADRLTPQSARVDALQRLGRASLFVYWIHVELVYGYATWLIHDRLALWQTLTGWALFCGLMFGAVVARDRLTNKRRNSRILGTSGSPARI